MKAKEFLFLLILLLLISCRKTQSHEFHVINGEIKNYNGKIYITQVVDSTYYSNKFKKDSTIVVNGNFEFRLSNKKNIPFPFYLSTKKTRTSWFILEPKDQQIIIDSLYQGVKPIINCKNSTIPNEELILEERKKPLLREFKLDFNKIRNVNFPKDSIESHMITIRKKMSNESILILKDFTKEYPNSYVAFWNIVIAQMYHGFSKELESAYKNLSSNIKQTKAANIFEDRMFNSKALCKGCYFPELKLKNKELKEFIFKSTDDSKASYILVDFWFSNCGPCIDQFPKLKEFHTKYYPNKLKIVSISTDITKNINNWYMVMKKNNIPWINYLDENGAEVSPLGINSFPTNYLLDGKGVILKKNISLMDLEMLLKDFD